MNNRRSILLAMLIAFSGLTVFQPAGAVIESGYIEDFSNTSAEKCTDQGYLMFGPGLAIGVSSVVLLGVPACHVTEGAVTPPPPVGQSASSSCNMGQANDFLPPVGPGNLDSLVDYVSVPACPLPANLIQPVDVQDSRVCDADAAHVKQCHMRD